jgi:tRNA-splicing ligase RtcB
MSCSHGAGRVLSRKKAKELLTVEHESKILDDLGVIHSIRGKKDLDEAPSAYKDINKVIEYQKDLVDVVKVLKPLCVIKG